MSSTRKSESSSSLTSTKTPFTGATADLVNSGVQKYLNSMNTSGSDYLDANMGKYNVGTNSAQKLALSNAYNTLKNSNITSVANGNNLDVSNDADVQAKIARGLKTLQDKWATGIDSTNASMGRAGVGSSSMRINSQNKLADTTQSNMADYQADQLSQAKKDAVSDMMNANTLLNNASNTANSYQSSLLQSNANALQQALAAKNIDTNTWEGWMKMMQLIANPTINSEGTSTTTQTDSDPWGVAASLLGGFGSAMTGLKTK